jgi:hypothetical protein
MHSRSSVLSPVEIGQLILTAFNADGQYVTNSSFTKCTEGETRLASCMSETYFHVLNTLREMGWRKGRLHSGNKKGVSLSPLNTVQADYGPPSYEWEAGQLVCSQCRKDERICGALPPLTMHLRGEVLTHKARFVFTCHAFRKTFKAGAFILPPIESLRFLRANICGPLESNRSNWAVSFGDVQWHIQLIDIEFSALLGVTQEAHKMASVQVRGCHRFNESELGAICHALGSLQWS